MTEYDEDMEAEAKTAKKGSHQVMEDPTMQAMTEMEEATDGTSAQAH